MAGAKPTNEATNRVGVGAVLDLLRGAGLAGELVAGDADLRRGAARLEHALEHLAELGRNRGADHAAPWGRRLRLAADLVDQTRRPQDAAVGDRRVGGAICIGVTERPWPIGRLPMVEPE